MNYSSSVHPHACGEHNNYLVLLMDGLGSSPRVWGTRYLCDYIDSELRFIPTRVGNTQQWRQTGIYHPVHPHACGEHSSSMSGYTLRTGSSPRVWGTPPHSRFINPRSRFIPTRVGNTGASGMPGRVTTVHPHACGEHEIRPMTLNVYIGSSPRVWGTRPVLCRGVDPGRFIPTRVGNTLRSCRA